MSPGKTPWAGRDVDGRIERIIKQLDGISEDNGIEDSLTRLARAMQAMRNLTTTVKKMKEHDPPPPDDKDTDECSPSAGASFHWPDSSYPDLSCHVSDIIELGSKAVDIVPQVYEILLRQPHLRDRGYLKATTRMTPLLSPEELMSRLADTTITSAAPAEFNGFLISQVAHGLGRNR
ncbi:hypothetical protein GTA08_BOTSDO12672 [Botryosphaeria dothidea]|uniref:Uncharacterized protein n=1 Tax=Botryosphaeria dothidea TaxID=55169 RepID=A0A8H4N5F9_9PEZI|nr:hypothetical protein GTA08_BOTSDO12672 [Botryosphaeria dothidea]